MNTKPVDYFVVRDSSEESTFATVSVRYKQGIVDEGAYAFFQDLRKAVTLWMKETKEGLAAAVETCKDFNIGDLALVSDESLAWIVSKIPTIEGLKVSTNSLNSSSNWWNFDTHLFDTDDSELDSLIEKEVEKQHEQ